MKKLQPWIKLPNGWIEASGLRDFRWARGEGADNLAALMALAAISHHIDPETGIARLTYDALCMMTTLSRAKLSAGLSVLAGRGLIEREPEGRSSFLLSHYDPASGWAQFPAKGLYRHDTIAAFTEFRLRLPAELEALKLYFLFASRRDRETNMAKITYDKIEDYSGVARNNIRRALSLLAANGLVHVEYVPSRTSENGVANAYRLAHLNTHRHMGTWRRGADEWDAPKPPIESRHPPTFFAEDSVLRRMKDRLS
jgi:DNA-binding transcriptional ArsR family regulator